MVDSVLLGVNIDHVATVRQARGGTFPCPVHAALVAEQAGADGITLHLREDRRHIQDHDVERLRPLLQTRMNLEMAATEEMVTIAERIQPATVCLVPEKRQELTTEGGLDVMSQQGLLRDVCQRLSSSSMAVSLFIDPESAQIEAAARCGAQIIELHTGCYAEAKTSRGQEAELKRLANGVTVGRRCGLTVNAGHGLNYHNVAPIVAIDGLHELNIGHSIIARAIYSGLANAVTEMKGLLTR